MKSVLPVGLAIACSLLALCACSGADPAYRDAFGKLIGGEDDGFTKLRTSNMVQVGAQSGMPQVHYATTVTLPPAQQCYTDGDGAGAYAACVVVEGATQSAADAAFTSQQSLAAGAAESLHLKATSRSNGDVKAEVYDDAGVSRAMLVEQKIGDTYSVTVLFARGRS